MVWEVRVEATLEERIVQKTEEGSLGAKNLGFLSRLQAYRHDCLLKVH